MGALRARICRGRESDLARNAAPIPTFPRWGKEQEEIPLLRRCKKAVSAAVMQAFLRHLTRPFMRTQTTCLIGITAPFIESPADPPAPRTSRLSSGRHEPQFVPHLKALCRSARRAASLLPAA